MKLKDAFDSRLKGGMIKHDHFFPIYDQHLSDLQRRSNLKVLEIGVYNGGSLYMWKNFLPNSQIVGIDIDPYCEQWADPSNNVRVYRGDQCDTSLLQRVCELEGPFDLIIDDGGHENNQIITSLEFLFPHLNNNGWYVVEDTFAAYQPNHSCDRTRGTNGEELNPILKDFDPQKTSMEFLKSLADKLNAWAYRAPEAEHLRVEGEWDEYEKNLYSMHFYDSIVFIQKKSRDTEDCFGKSVWYTFK